MDDQSLSGRVLKILSDKSNLSRGRLIQILEEEGATQKDASATLDQLEKEKKISTIIDPVNAFIRFITSKRERWLLSIYFITTLNAFTWYLIPDERVEFVWIRYIVGTLFIFLVPGASLVSVLNLEKLFGQLEVFIIIIILSIVLEPAFGLILNYTPWGVDPVALLVTLSLFSYILSGVSIITRWRIYGQFENTIVTLVEK